MCLYNFQIEYPEIEDNTKPRHRFMSSFEQVPSVIAASLCMKYQLPAVYADSLSVHILFSNALTFFWCCAECNLQKVQSFDKRYQYLLFAAEPYEIIAFKVITPSYVQYICISVNYTNKFYASLFIF